MNGEQVSYKVTLLANQDDKSSETKSEVRRFVVPQDCSTSMVYLKEKLRSIFGRQVENGMKITWRDEDGDDVCIESDEELVIAPHEMKNCFEHHWSSAQIAHLHCDFQLKLIPKQY